MSEKLTTKTSARLRQAEARIKDWLLWAGFVAFFGAWMFFLTPLSLTLILVLIISLCFPGMSVFFHILWMKHRTENKTLDKSTGWFYFTKVYKKAIVLLWVLFVFFFLMVIGILAND